MSLRRSGRRRALQESEARFRAVANTAPVLIWVAGTDKLCIFFNKSWLDFTGRTLEQELGNGWTEGVHPDDFAGCLKTYVEAFDARQPFTMEYRLRRHDGEYRWISDHGVPRYDAEQNFLGYIGSCVDLTERARAEAALRESEERLAVASEGGGAGLWDLRIDTGEVWATPRMRELFQLGANERLTFEKFVQAVHPEDRESIIQASQQALQTGVEMRVEHRVLLPDGGIRWIGGRGRPHYDSTGIRNRLTGASVDVTERKQAEKAIQESEQKYRRLHESMRDAVARADMAGRFQDCNPAFEQMLGYSLEELRSLTCLQITPEKWHPEEERILEEQILGRGYSDVYEKEFRCKDGTVIAIELRTFLLRDESGEPTAMWGIVRDITERKRKDELCWRARNGSAPWPRALWWASILYRTGGSFTSTQR